MIAKGRFRQNLPGRQTEAIASAIRNSQNALITQLHKVPEVLRENAPGLQKHLERVAAMNPADIERRARALGYEELKPAPVVPGFDPVTVIPKRAPLGTIAPAGIVAKAVVKKKKAPLDVPVAIVAPAGKVALATVASAVLPNVAVAVVPNQEGWGAFVAHYLQNKAHSKDKSLLDYLQTQFASGLTFNASTKRFAKR